MHFMEEGRENTAVFHDAIRAIPDAKQGVHTEKLAEDAIINVFVLSLLKIGFLVNHVEIHRNISKLNSLAFSKFHS